MNINIKETNGIKIAVLVEEGITIKNIEDAVDLLGNSYYLGASKVIINKENITPDFFDLKTKIAGEILQKFSNYRTQLAIVGDFSEYTSKSLKDFIYESNNGGSINFVHSAQEAEEKLLQS
jgi:hypothetical protein